MHNNQQVKLIGRIKLNRYKILIRTKRIWTKWINHCFHLKANHNTMLNRNNKLMKRMSMKTSMSYLTPNNKSLKAKIKLKKHLHQSIMNHNQVKDKNSSNLVVWNLVKMKAKLRMMKSIMASKMNNMKRNKPHNPRRVFYNKKWIKLMEWNKMNQRSIHFKFMKKSKRRWFRWGWRQWWEWGGTWSWTYLNHQPKSFRNYLVS